MFHFISYASTSGSSYTEVSYYLHLSQTHHNAICQTPPYLPYHIHQPLSWSFQHSPSSPSLPSPLSISITFLSVSPHFLPSAKDQQHLGVPMAVLHATLQTMSITITNSSGLRTVPCCKP